MIEESQEEAAGEGNWLHGHFSGSRTLQTKKVMLGLAIEENSKRKLLEEWQCFPEEK